MARAPGRVNLIGEHTDYNGGFVLPMAIHVGVTASVTERSDSRVTVRSAQVPGEVVEFADVIALSQADSTGWASYVIGSVWSLLQTFPGIRLGLDIVIDGDVPRGSGLSSSAALECAVVTAVADLWGLSPSRRECAAIAQRAENEFVGVPTGAMDQVASMLGEEGHAIFFDIGEDALRSVAFDPDSVGLELIVVDTRLSHALVDGAYAARRRACERAAQVLGVEYLREISDAAFAAEVLTAEPDFESLVPIMRHVVMENGRVLDAVACLEQGDFVSFGNLMYASHESLRDDFRVSCPELDAVVEESRDVGAWGARMTGGGFGGSALVLISRREVPALVDAVTHRFAAEGWVEPSFMRVKASRGAHVRHDEVV